MQLAPPLLVAETPRRAKPTGNVRDGVRAAFAQEHPLRILATDDDSTCQTILKIVLTGLGYDAVFVNNGKECLAAATSQSFDVILSDVNMPKMGGLECTRQIRAKGLDLPIIAISGNPAPDIREECREAGMTDFLAKPFKLADLQRALRKASIQVRASRGEDVQEMSEAMGRLAGVA